MSTGIKTDFLPPSKASRAPSVHTGLAITSFILAFFIPVVPFILGWVDIAAAHKAGRRASGLAEAAMFVNALALVLFIVLVAVLAAQQPSDQTQQFINCLNQQLNNPNLDCSQYMSGG